MSKNQLRSGVRVARKSARLNQGVDAMVVPGLKTNSRHQNNKGTFNHKIKSNANVFVEDIYEKAQNAKEMSRRPTGLVYDTRMVNHHCLWDANHQECPDRFMKTLDRCEELGLVERCHRITAREATLDELLTVHSQTHIDQLKLTDGCPDVERLEQFASTYDAVYFHPETYKLALLSAGSTIQLVDEVCRGTIQNGMAIVRPPGHHAMESAFNGYCFFNNVAMAATHALDHLGLRRVLIVDWDVHHGQGTQQMFYNDSRVVYFSIHRFEHGEFWPNLRESDFDYIGEGEGTGFNFNIPLNVTGMGDADYMAIFHQVLLPMASEFQPELVIVSAGYDAAIGCPEGEMLVTPACYAHLLSSLMGLASGKIAVILEGGYCVRSLAEGAALTLRALLGDPSPSLPALPAPSLSIQESILNSIYSHRAYWQCFQFQGTFLETERDLGNENQHWPSIKYSYKHPKLEKYPTRDTCPVQSQQTRDDINRKLDLLIAETKLLKSKQNVCLIYDPLMMEHRNMNDPVHPERPSRIQQIYEKHLEYNLLDRLLTLQSRSASREELLLVHDEIYLNNLQQLCVSVEGMTDDVKYQHSILEKKNSVFIHPQSYKGASLAAGSLLQVVDSVMQGESRAGVAIIRPPGHHAESFQACGFCIFNNISIAAKYAKQNYGVKRILLLDWDVHHGNGTQRLFLSDPQVLYLSIHRYDHGMFFPGSEDGAATVVGSGDGVGFTVNIPWNQKGMGNAEYIAAFQQLVLPIAYQFSPELVLVSAGFDAAVGDPLGGCKVSPETYGLLTSWLMPLAMGRVIICLEGGYNLISTSYAMTMCSKALLGDPLPPIDLQFPLKTSAVADLRAVLGVQQKHWSALCFNKNLPKEDVLNLLASKKQNTDTKNNDEIVNKLTQKDNSIHTRRDQDDTIENLDEKFKSQMYISGDSNESVNPNLSEIKELATQVPSDGSHDVTGNSSGVSRAGDEPSPGPSNGRHVQQLHITIMDSIHEDLATEGGFAVYPRHDCPHLPAVAPVPGSGIDITSPCFDCAADSCATVENWICLSCYTVRCGRIIREHMLHHFIESNHPIVMGLTDLSVWCYICDAYIESPVLYDAKNSAHIIKFGQDMPNVFKQ